MRVPSPFEWELAPFLRIPPRLGQAGPRTAEAQREMGSQLFVPR